MPEEPNLASMRRGDVVVHRRRRVGSSDLVTGVLRPRAAYRVQRLLRDPKAHADLAVHGYHVTETRIDHAAIAALREGCTSWVEASGLPDDGRFRSSFGTLHDPSGVGARASVIEALLPALRPQVTADAQLRPSVFQVKPPGPLSGVRMHQDRSMVDERSSYALFAWTALTDITIEDGPLLVLPGSHRFGVWTRMYSQVDQLGEYQEVIERNSMALELRAGQVVWFDNALIHGSLANHGSVPRLGVSAVASAASERVRVAAAPFDDDGRAAVLYELAHDDIAQPKAIPISEGRRLGIVERDDLVFSPRSLEFVAWLHRRLHPGAPGVVPPPGATCR